MDSVLSSKHSDKKKKVRIDNKLNEIRYFNSERFSVHLTEFITPKFPSKQFFPARSRYAVFRNFIGQSLKAFGQPSVRMDVCIVTVDLNRSDSSAGRYFAATFKYLFKKRLKKLQVEDALLCAIRDAQLNWNERFPQSQDLCSFSVLVIDKQYSGRGLLVNIGNSACLCGNQLIYDTLLYPQPAGTENITQAEFGADNYQHIRLSRNVHILQNKESKKDRLHTLAAFGRSSFVSSVNTSAPKVVLLKNLQRNGVLIMNSTLFMIQNSNSNIKLEIETISALRSQFLKDSPDIVHFLPNPFGLQIQLNY